MKEERVYSKQQRLDSPKALILVDIINGFLNEGNLADKSLNRIVPAVVELVEHFVNKGYVIIALNDGHPKDSAEFSLFPGHCEEGSWQSQLIDELKPYEKNMFVVNKNSNGGAHVREFQQVLDGMPNLKEIVWAGVSSDVCVMRNVGSTMDYMLEQNRAIKYILPKDVTGAYDLQGHPQQEYNQSALAIMQGWGVDVVPTYNYEQDFASVQ